MLRSAFSQTLRKAGTSRQGSLLSARAFCSSPLQSSDKPTRAEADSTSALDYKLAHRLRKLPPLPSLEPPMMDASEAVSNILYNTPPPSAQPFKRHILNTLVQNEPGVLSRVAGTLAARGFNIDSLVVCGTEIKDLSRMCIVLRGQDGVVEQARRQLEDLVPVWAVLDYTNTKVIERELMLVKVSILGPEYYEESQYGLGGAGGQPSSSHVPPELVVERERTKVEANAQTANAASQTPLTPTEALRVKSDNMRSVIALAEQFRGRVVDVSSSSVIVELSGKSSRCDAFLKLVRPFGVLECARSGTMVLPRSPITSSWSGSDDMAEEELSDVDAGLLPPG
ncbi:acetolactate synthase [Violaceomyces palustris]|uniref:Acetolactate synthase n=1 Tax=Violaceomyces palustris TaxID=1673888 RepID=A0ACD0P5E2_9BASI|nr:acetolactate synthase [Violaceomyces palustris]